MAAERALKRCLRHLTTIYQRASKYEPKSLACEVRKDYELWKDEWEDFKTKEAGLKHGFGDENAELQEKVEDFFFDLKDMLLQWLHKYEQKPVAAATTSGAEKTVVNELIAAQKKFLEEITAIKKENNEVKLPPLDIPKFSGKDETLFPSFRNMFETTVHNRNIPNTHKFQHLKSLLTDEARDLILHVDITEDLYEETWERIKKRYDKKRQSVTSFIKKFMSQPSITRPSSKALHHLHDTSDQILRGLKALNDPKSETRDPWLIHILVAKLDDESKQAWAEQSVLEDFPTLKTFFDFLNGRCDVLETYDTSARSSFNKPDPQKTRNMLSSNFTLVCQKCEGEHYVTTCEEFLKLNINERREMVAQKRLCFNCLSSKHQAYECRNKRRCEACKRRHHTLLHTEMKKEESTTASITATEPVDETSTASFTANVPMRDINSGFHSLLPTAIVMVSDISGYWHQCRALLDSGSESSFISENMVRRLNIKRKRKSLIVQGMTEGNGVTKGFVTLDVRSRFEVNNRLTIRTLIMGKLPEKIPSYERKLSNDMLKLKESIAERIADPFFNEVCAIDLVIGSEYSLDILMGSKLYCEGLTAHNSKFGWVFTGLGDKLEKCDGNQGSQFMHCQLVCDVDATLKRFWELEEVAPCNPLSREDEDCEKFFNETTKRDDKGRYIVAIPFKKAIPELGNSYKMAIQRFYNLEKKFKRDGELRTVYTNVMRDYIDQGHMIQLQPNEVKVDDHLNYYLPHHAVMKQESTTTKLRVVFDGSAKTSNGVSLNQNMLVGPTIQPTLWSTLIRFRQHKIAITADIEKMYRQVKLNDEHQTYQRVVWRENDSEMLRHYKLTRVTFGLASSAFLAIRALQQISKDEVSNIPAVNQAIINDFYVDDLLSGAETINEACDLKCELAEVLRRGGFELRKWKSNSDQIGDHGDEAKVISSENDDQVKVLGIHWRPTDDCFVFKISNLDTMVPTKRMVISEFSRIFDPLGWLSPAIVLGKILYQKLWKLKLDWDEKLPKGHREKYMRIRDEFKKFEEVNIPRYIGSTGKIEYHGFCDASKEAYAAVIYIRTEVDGEINTQLVTAKTKVAPLNTEKKMITNARLELLGALLLAKLTNEFLKLGEAEFHAWTDSTQVLSYLSDYPGRWKAFVGNRTEIILETLPRPRWNYINTKDNPADPASRGILPSKLITSELWWKGPNWLKQARETWPIQPIPQETELQIEQDKKPIQSNVALAKVNSTLEAMFIKYSSFHKIIRVLATLRRYMDNLLKIKGLRKFGPLSIIELRGASNFIFSYIQQIAFPEEVKLLKEGKTINKRSTIIALTPILDKHGVLRVGGRLHNYDGDYDYKHPVIIPRNHILAKLLMRDVHITNLHPGPTLTFNLTRQKYWVIGGRPLARKLTKECIRCFKHNAKPGTQLMGELPTIRVTPARPFSNSGVDYAGPIQIVNKKGRGAKILKSYIAVFICLVTKAVHIELVSDLTTEAFMAALRRFVSRRGLPSQIMSDNGTNFIGAKRQIDAILKEKETNELNHEIQEYLNTNGINWKFIPPDAPNYGGLWESAVKSVKTLLLKSVYDTHLTFEELTTLLYQIEAILNSRPICRTTSSNNDSSFEALTPAHFLIGSTPHAVPDREIAGTIPSNRLTRYEIIQQRVQLFWRKFQTEYIHNLQQRDKWRYKTRNLEVNELVLINDDHLPSCKWLLGRIVSVHPDKANIVRVVTLRTQNSTLKRHVNKLCRLPIPADS